MRMPPFMRGQLVAWSIIQKALIFGSVDRQRDVLLKRAIKGGEEDGWARTTQTFCRVTKKKNLAPEKAAAEKTGTGSLSLTLDYAAPNN
jgi:hypothetical protein